MAHTCPTCGLNCHCGGDIDDINFGVHYGCICCDGEDDWDEDEYWDQLEKLEEQS